jgi:hypothetical protein
MRLIYSNEESLILTITSEHTDEIFPILIRVEIKVLRHGTNRARAFATIHD